MIQDPWRTLKLLIISENSQTKNIDSKLFAAAQVLENLNQIFRSKFELFWFTVKIFQFKLLTNWENSQIKIWDFSIQVTIFQLKFLRREKILRSKTEPLWFQIKFCCSSFCELKHSQVKILHIVGFKVRIFHLELLYELKKCSG